MNAPKEHHERFAGSKLWTVLSYSRISSSGIFLSGIFSKRDIYFAFSTLSPYK
jgi:hypothetical protein